jgi:Fe-S cluster assembly ATP-binding protein
VLEINDLHAGIGDREILKGITLRVNSGEVHAVMGPNGSGKSTLAQVLAGNPTYQVTRGTVDYNGQNLLEMDPEVRAQNGIFLASRSPISCAPPTTRFARQTVRRK